MFQLKSDHIHSVQQKSQDNFAEDIQIESIVKKKIRKVRIKTLPSNDPNQHFYADAIIPQLQVSMSEISGAVFDAISFVRKSLELKVYTSIVDDQDDYLKRMFYGESNQKNWVLEAIRDTAQEVQQNIIKDIMNGDEYTVKKIPKLTKDDIFGNKGTEGVIRIKERMLKAKILSLKSDLSESNTEVAQVDIINSNLSDLYGSKSSKTKNAAQFVKKIRKQQEQIKQYYRRIEQNKKFERKKAEQQRREIELKIRQERHSFLNHQYEEKRRLKEQQRMEQKKKEEQFKQFMKKHKNSKPLFKKKEEQYFKKFVIPDNQRKLEILKEIREQHQPISRQQLSEHEKQYLQIKQDHMYEKNASIAMESRAKKQEKNIYKSKFHSLIEKQEKQRSEKFLQDPLQEKTLQLQKRWEYATEIKAKFKPKTSPKKRQESKKWEQQAKSALRNSSRRSADGYKNDGKQNLENLHKYIAQLRAKGQIRYGSASNTIQHTSKPKYKDYLKDLGTSRSAIRHSIDYSTLAEMDAQRLKINAKKVQENAIRRQQYLTHLGSYNMDHFMSEKKKLDDDYLDTVKAKIALINKYQ